MKSATKADQTARLLPFESSNLVFFNNSMQLKAIQAIYHKELDPLYSREEVDHFFYWVIEHYLGLERFALVLTPYLSVTKEEEQPLFEALAQLKEEKPIQYILESANFMDMEFTVNEAVLIPRPETEELVRWIISDYEAAKESKKKLKIMDIGTGSGCIAIALSKHLPEAEVQALDISERALEIAAKNAERHSATVLLFQADITTLNMAEDRFDIIVSNPPYVRHSEAPKMKKNVKGYEPHTALFVPDRDPLLFYRHIARYALGHLKPRGRLYLEVNQYLATEIEDLLQAHNFSEIELRKDSFGNPRMLRGQRTAKIQN